MSIEESVFEGYAPDFEALTAHGFAETESGYRFTVPIPDTDFTATVTVSEAGAVSGRVTDRETGEEYLPLRAADAHGSYVAKVREAYLSVLSAIRRYCFVHTGKAASWLIPANPSVYDVVGHFEQYGSIIWKQPRGCRLGDYVYIYMGRPYSCILFKCEVIRADFADYADRCMELRVLRCFTEDEFPLPLLREHGLKTVRFSGRLPESVAEFLYDE